MPFAVPERLTVVDSTNRYLADLARDGLPDRSQVPEGYAVVADRQTKGRGRLSRTWEAPAGTGLLCSILFRPDLAPDQLHLTAWAVALAAVRACREIAGVELVLKWPNDLLARSPAAVPGGASAEGGGGAGEPKVAGVLAEVLPRLATGASLLWPEAPSGVVVGIGINVNWPPDWPPEHTTEEELASIADTATALNRIAGREIDRSELATRLLGHTGEWNARLSSEHGRRSLASQYRLVCSTIGRKVRVQLADESVTGRAVDVDDAGRLVVSNDTCLRTISAGDVVHLR